MAPPTPVGKRQTGIVYLALIVSIAVLGISLALAGTVWESSSRRDREEELLFVGLQIQRAIRQYYESSPGGNKQYPKTLEDLLLDTRYPGTRRYLRQVFIDPLTRQRKWGLVIAPEGGIMGIYSLADGKPIKQNGFPASLEWRGKQPTYRGWEFVHREG